VRMAMGSPALHRRPKERQETDVKKGDWSRTIGRKNERGNWWTESRTRKIIYRARKRKKPWKEKDTDMKTEKNVNRNRVDVLVVRKSKVARNFASLVFGRIDYYLQKTYEILWRWHYMSLLK
jgi:hypothetical protein